MASPFAVNPFEPGESNPSLHQSHSQRWVLPYSDLVTLLLGLFVAMTVLGAKPDQANLTNHNKTTAQKQQTAQTVENKLPEITENTTAINQTVKTIQQKLDTAKLPAQVLYQPNKGIVIRLGESVLFNPGSAQLQPQAIEPLGQLATLLQETKGNIRVEGHTDTTPIHSAQFPSNWELSTARAIAVLRYISEQSNINPQQLSAAGYGAYQPIANNTTETGKLQNRRVDIVVFQTQNNTTATKKQAIINKTTNLNASASSASSQQRVTTLPQQGHNSKQSQPAASIRTENNQIIVSQ
jgi:chemotaxis protein MotB